MNFNLFNKNKKDQTDTGNNQSDSPQEIARSKQIFDAAMDFGAKRTKEHPDTILCMAIASAFSLGAEWADKHPASDYESKRAWIEAQNKTFTEMFEREVLQKTRWLISFCCFHSVAVPCGHQNFQ